MSPTLAVLTSALRSSGRTYTSSSVSLLVSGIMLSLFSNSDAARATSHHYLCYIDEVDCDGHAIPDDYRCLQLPSHPRDGRHILLL